MHYEGLHYNIERKQFLYQKEVIIMNNVYT